MQLLVIVSWQDAPPGVESMPVGAAVRASSCGYGDIRTPGFVLSPESFQVPKGSKDLNHEYLAQTKCRS